MRETDLLHTPWRKSSYSGANEGECVEIAPAGRMVAARDSKDPSGPVLCFGTDAWHAFCGQIKSGAYDLAAGFSRV
ncbi:DUF397 domain-containing protein [Actinomadura xylanilytica]|uniref:DUF397 domain-containing protein n=1 Tax=Actinomadura xylanilytica TaxID=887459 RepID=UPI00255B3C81|nr:DUF397 domain-containing protein [Actinomadura xylanilytica]MDL4776558.1 DUF397 domain-containing protein [Actinomadura xylanilytica]